MSKIGIDDFGQRLLSDVARAIHDTDPCTLHWSASIFPIGILLRRHPATRILNSASPKTAQRVRSHSHVEISTGTSGSMWI